MADDVDRANHLAEQQLAQALALQRAAAMREEIDPSLLPGQPRDCVDCGQPVPAARLAVMPHATRCVACQADAEAAGWL